MAQMQVASFPDTGIAVAFDNSKKRATIGRYCDDDYQPIACIDGQDRELASRQICDVISACDATTAEATAAEATTAEATAAEATAAEVCNAAVPDYSVRSGKVDFTFGEADAWQHSRAPHRPTLLVRPRAQLPGGYGRRYRDVLDPVTLAPVGRMLHKHPDIFALELHSPIGGLTEGMVVASIHNVHDMHYKQDMWHVAIKKH